MKKVRKANMAYVMHDKFSFLVLAYLSITPFYSREYRIITLFEILGGGGDGVEPSRPPPPMKLLGTRLISRCWFTTN